ncbi:MAG: hypothetical protein A2Z43_03625 [Syntrophobacterales bacterium RBG_19FT_COMBO_59_10]|nr:MAG: hypothetical protein A2Z43_03625 [Syntrophobacterales bacterium RBG_19FT_COMBO_59_10]
MYANRHRSLAILLFVPSLFVAFLFACGQNTSQDDFAKKAQCFEIGREYYKKALAGIGAESSIYKLSYEVAYNKKLNTCLYYGETAFRDDPSKKVNAYIRDLFSNTNLYFMAYGADNAILQNGSSFKTEAEFLNKYRELIMCKSSK